MPAIGAQDQIYPASYAEDSLDAYLARHGRTGRRIYLLSLAILVAVGVALPVIRVHPSVRSTGVIRPAVEKQEVRARLSGIVARVALRENAAVREGDTLALLQAESLGERRALLDTRVAERRRLLHDLALLAAGPLPLASAERTLQSPALIEEHASMAIALAAFTPRLEQATRELTRTRGLQTQGFATQSEVDEKTFAVASAEAERAAVRARALADWASRLAAVRQELAAQETEGRQLTQESALYAVVAPVTGTLEQVSSLSPGSFLSAADRLAVVSPTSTLHADIDVRPRDVGLLHPGMPVRLRVDAFDASDWGFVEGRITEISSDVVPSGPSGAGNRMTPTFRVRVALAQDHLALASGVRGQLKRGMTLQARFLLPERSLWQLLFDDVGDWLDPTRSAPADSTRVAAGRS